MPRKSLKVRNAYPDVIKVTSKPSSSAYFPLHSNQFPTLPYRRTLGAISSQSCPKCLPADQLSSLHGCHDGRDRSVTLGYFLQASTDSEMVPKKAVKRGSPNISEPSPRLEVSPLYPLYHLYLLFRLEWQPPKFRKSFNQSLTTPHCGTKFLTRQGPV